MEAAFAIAVFCVGGVAGAVLGWLVCRKAGTADFVRLETELRAANETVVEQKAKLVEAEPYRQQCAVLAAELANEKRSTDDKLKLLDDAQGKLKDAFDAVSRQALDKNSESFVAFAKSVFERYQQSAQDDLQRRQERIADVVSPLNQSLQKVETTIRQLETARAGVQGALRQQLDQLSLTHADLTKTTSDLKNALKDTKLRGQWGEITLRRIIELAGMTRHCDFYEQVSAQKDESRIRPDVLVRLPGERSIIIDSKAPMNSYWAAQDSESEETRTEYLKAHSKAVRDHMLNLSKKNYWEAFESSPEYVILFIPIEALLSCVLEHNPGLVEEAIEKNVMIATPANLLAMLKATALGWKQDNIAKEAKRIAGLGRELYDRINTLAGHTFDLGKSINRSAEYYNKMIGTMERQILSTARKLKDMDVIGDGARELNDLDPLEIDTRKFQAKEFVLGEIRISSNELLAESGE